MCDHYYIKRMINHKLKWICLYCGREHKEYSMYMLRKAKKNGEE